MIESEQGTLSADGEDIAWLRDGDPASDRPGFIWLGGFRSDMTGTKARALAGQARAEGRACLRFDYSGHGASSGTFEDGTIGRWLAQSMAVFDALTAGPQILVGSSMGGWIALLMLRAHLAAVGRRDMRIAGLLLIAPAADMTERLIWANASDEVRRAIAVDGVYMRPSAYGDGDYPITRSLIEDGRNHLLLGTPLDTPCPVRIVHGLEDPDVPWQLSLEIAETLASDDLSITLVKDGDHRLSTPDQLKHVFDALAQLP